MAAVVVLTMLLASAWASDDTKSRATLRGIDAVYVLVENMDPELRAELRKRGLTVTGLEAGVKRKLETAGLKVLSEQDFRMAPYPSVLYVNLQILMPETKYGYTVEGEQISREKPAERYFYRVDVELRQMASLLRDPAIKGSAATWSVASMGLRRLARIEGDVMDQASTFVNAYVAMNPK
jgi:hypothetical protein